MFDKISLIKINIRKKEKRTQNHSHLHIVLHNFEQLIERYIARIRNYNLSLVSN